MSRSIRALSDPATSIPSLYSSSCVGMLRVQMGKTIVWLPHVCYTKCKPKNTPNSYAAQPFSLHSFLPPFPPFLLGQEGGRNGALQSIDLCFPLHSFSHHAAGQCIKLGSMLGNSIFFLSFNLLMSIQAPLYHNFLSPIYFYSMKKCWEIGLGMLYV